MTDQLHLAAFYLKLVQDTAEGTQKVVCEKCGIPLEPTSARELRPVPVYEDSEPHTLLAVANIRTPTEIKWATNHSNEYLPAYFKRYRRDEDRRLCNEIVVTANNYCIARFFAAKELMHCFMDDDGYPSTNSVSLVHELIDDLVAGGTLTERQEPQTVVDEMAWVGAVHYLIPNGWIPLLQKIYATIQAEEPSANGYLHLAQLIRVPENVLRVRLRHSGTKA